MSNLENYTELPYAIADELIRQGRRVRELERMLGDIVCYLRIIAEDDDKCNRNWILDYADRLDKLMKECANNG